MASPPVTERLRGFRSFDEWQRDCEDNATRHRDAQLELEAIQSQLIASGMHGYCAVCAAQREFTCKGLQRSASISFRESLACVVCRSNARQRAAAAALFDAIDPQRSTVYLTEQASRFHLHLRRRLKTLIGSEFVASAWRRLRIRVWLLRHGNLESVRRQDVTALTLATASVDAVVSMDVLEHVHDYRRALAEFARVLRPGGVLVLTVPFYSDRAHSTLLARIDADGRIEHLHHPPEHHGDPLSGGVLCFHHFGWELLDAIREAGFADAEALRLRDPAQGFPEAQWIIRCHKL